MLVTALSSKSRARRQLILEQLEDRFAPGNMLNGLLSFPLGLSFIDSTADPAIVAAPTLATDLSTAAVDNPTSAETIGSLANETTLWTTEGSLFAGWKSDGVGADNAAPVISAPAWQADALSPLPSEFGGNDAFAAVSLAPTQTPPVAAMSNGAANISDASAVSFAIVATQAPGYAPTAGNEPTSNAGADAGTASPMLQLPSATPFRGPGGGGGGGGGGGPRGYTPAQIRHAYGFDQLAQNGAGQTIAIVDAYDDPNIVSDLNTFSTQFGLPTTTSGAFTFTKAFAQGSKPSANGGWAQEISLDVEWAHAIAPHANIMLVEAASNSLTDLFGAVDYAVGHSAGIVSMSWGAGDSSGESSLDSHFNKPGVMFLASAGDAGGVVNYPAASPYVVSVGGTSLPLDSSGNRTGAESAWSSGGGGASLYESEPTYQVNYGINSTNGGRGTPDVAYNADPNTGVAVYDSYSYQGLKGWLVIGGTSAGAPQWAGLVALVDQGRATPLTSADLTNSAIYNAAVGSLYSANYHDITTGSNGYPATTGYDLATGLGSPIANALVPYLTTH